MRKPPSASNGQSLPKRPSQEKNVIVIIWAHVTILSHFLEPGAWDVHSIQCIIHFCYTTHICLSPPAFLQKTVCAWGRGTLPGLFSLHPRLRPVVGKCGIRILSPVHSLLSHVGEPGHPGGPGKDGVNGEKGERGQKLCSISRRSTSEPSVVA